VVRVKICGITNVADARAAAALGADALGFNFVRGSRRYVTPEMAKAIIVALPPFVVPVGVFADAPITQVREICDFCGIQTVQLHGDESPAYVARLHHYRRIKAVRVATLEDLRLLERYTVDAYLLDAKVPGELGGTGESFDWNLAAEGRRHGLIILAGGLTPENVAEAVRRARPYAVDVASGVEVEPGIKDRHLIAAFVAAAKSAV